MTNAQKDFEESEIAAAVAYMESRMDKLPESSKYPNHAREISTEEFDAAADALIGPFSKAVERAYAN